MEGFLYGGDYIYFLLVGFGDIMEIFIDVRIFVKSFLFKNS